MRSLFHPIALMQLSFIFLIFFYLGYFFGRNAAANQSKTIERAVAVLIILKVAVFTAFEFKVRGAILPTTLQENALALLLAGIILFSGKIFKTK